jgi:hypothetical protein
MEILIVTAQLVDDNGTTDVVTKRSQCNSVKQ